MIKVRAVVLFVICLCCRPARAETFWLDSAAADSISPGSLSGSSEDQIQGLRTDLSPPVKKILSLEFGPKIVELKALYFERRDETAASAGALPSDPTGAKMGRYFDLLATTSRFNGKLIGESELAYSPSGFSNITDQRPMMSRLALRGNWQDASYGGLYQSFGSGFMSTDGTKIDHARDENQLWGEYDFKIFRLKGTFGELREGNPDTNLPTLTKIAATSINLNRWGWTALLASNYSVSTQKEASIGESHAFTHGLSLAYRPGSFFSIEPNFSFKNEWDPATGLKTDTPSGGLALSCTPFRNVQFIGRTSYARALSEDPLKDGSTLNTALSLNWIIGKALGAEQSLSLQVDYRNQLYAHPSTNTSQANLTGMIQLKIAGF